MKTNLEFKKKDGLWVSQDVTVTGDYNLHVERDKAGSIGIEQRTAGGEFSPCIVPDCVRNAEGKAFDFDFIHAVYPKTIRVISTVQPESGVVTMTE